MRGNIPIAIGIPQLIQYQQIPAMSPSSSNVPCTLQTLPPELLLDLASHVCSHDLLSLRAVSRHLCSVLTAVALRVKPITYLNQSHSRLIPPSPHLIDYVTDLAFLLDKNKLSCGRDYKRYRGWGRGGTSSVPIGIFTNVQSIRVVFPRAHGLFQGGDYELYRFYLQQLVLQSFAGAPATFSPTSLSIDGLRTDPHDPSLMHLALKEFLSRTTTLHLGIGKPYRVWNWTVTSLSAIDLWLHQAPSVERLELRSEIYITRFSLRLPGFTNLRELSLCRFCFSDKRKPFDIEEMIVSDAVAGTLEKLVLRHCAVVYTARGKTTWAGILTRFRMKLTRLKRFEPQKKIGYKTRVGGPGLCSEYQRYGRPEEVYKADVEALLALWEGIGQVQGFGPERLVHYFD